MGDRRPLGDHAGPTIHPGRLPYGRIACARGGVAMDDHYVTLRPCYPDGHAAACPYVNHATLLPLAATLVRRQPCRSAVGAHCMRPRRGGGGRTYRRIPCPHPLTCNP